jgi:hypothetical protein
MPILALAALALHVARADEVAETYRDKGFNGTVSSILVVGVTPDTNVRRMFENSMLRALRDAGVTGESSLARMGSTEPLTAAAVAAAAERAKADSVLVTRVLDVQTENPDASTTFVEYFTAYAADDPLPVVTTHTVRVRSDLYVLAGQRRVWGVESTAVDKQNLFGVIDGIASAVTAKLRKDRLIR